MSTPQANNRKIEYASLIWIIVFALFNLFLAFIGFIAPITCYEYATVEEVRSCAWGLLALFVGIPILTTLISIVLYVRRRYISAMLAVAIPSGMLLGGMVVGGIQRLMVTGRG